MHRYHLDTSSRKHICPQCGHRTLVAYVDASGNLLDPLAGRCDRQNKCAYHLPPRDLPHTGPRAIHRSRLLRRRHVPVTPNFIRPPQVKATIGKYGANSLIHWLKHTFRDLMEPQEVEKMATIYGVGTARLYGGSPIFWQLDMQGRARTGKIMGYNPATGRRVKHPRPQLTWIHRLKQAHSNNSDGSDFRLKQVLFGSHLAALNPSATILLMESEKAALITALVLAWGGAFGCFVPMATGGCGNLPADALRMADPYGMLAALRGRKTVLVPDAGMYPKWLQRAQQLARFCKVIGVSTAMEPDKRMFEVPEETHSGDGPDDMVLLFLNHGLDPTTPIMNLI